MLPTSTGSSAGLLGFLPLGFWPATCFVCGDRAGGGPSCKAAALPALQLAQFEHWRLRLLITLGPPPLTFPAAAALRAVAFRTDKDSEPTTPPSFTADSAKQLLNSKTAEAGSALSDAATTLLATAQVREPGPGPPGRRPLGRARGCRAGAARLSAQLVTAGSGTTTAQNTCSAIPQTPPAGPFHPAQTKWEESDNKPAIVATGFAALFALYITNGIVST